VFDTDNGTEAVKLALTVAPDVVLLDRMLPGLDGVEVCRQIRAQSSVPIIMVTARDSELDTVVGLEIGADDYIAKPFSLNILLARIRAVLRRVEARTERQLISGESIAYGPFILYPEKYVAQCDGVDLELTPKLFELFLLLAKTPGRVFTRGFLLDRVWGIDYAGETRTVDVHITWLRKKIESDPSEPRYLLTVRGVGYKLTELHA